MDLTLKKMDLTLKKLFLYTTLNSFHLFFIFYVKIK